MKRMFGLLIAAGVLLSCGGRDASASKNLEDSATHAQRMNAVSDTANYTEIQWLDSTYQDIGKVKKGQVAEVTWRLKNVGSKPLVVAQVTPGCGCTVADKPEEPIMPGGESVIRAKFNSSGQSAGEHRKYVAVTANARNATTQQLQFRVDVTE